MQISWTTNSFRVINKLRKNHQNLPFQPPQTKSFYCDVNPRFELAVRFFDVNFPFKALFTFLDRLDRLDRLWTSLIDFSWPSWSFWSFNSSFERMTEGFTQILFFCPFINGYFNVIALKWTIRIEPKSTQNENQSNNDEWYAMFVVTRYTRYIYPVCRFKYKKCKVVG